MITSDDATHILDCLRLNHIQGWLTGEWGIDALLGMQTRPHKDLDILLLMEDISRMRALFAGEGYQLLELWSENRWAIDSDGIKIPTAFILQDPKDRQIDIHAISFNQHEVGIPAWDDDRGLVFSVEDLSAEGVINGEVVSCISPAMQVFCHTGYDMPGYQRQDITTLCQHYGLIHPDL